MPDRNEITAATYIQRASSINQGIYDCFYVIKPS